MKNADRLRRMTDVELAEALVEIINDNAFDAVGEFCGPDKETILKWLKEEQ